MTERKTERRRRILIVDDHDDNLDLLERRLQRRGYEALTAASGAEALEILARKKVDLVILDVMMPGMSGLDVLRTLRKTKPATVLPVIMATAKSDSSDVVEALELGANDYVIKPIDIDVLVARMGVHLRTTEPSGTVSDVGPGFVLDRKYELGERIGSGGFGTVFRASHRTLKKPVAVKILHPHLTLSQRAMRRFALEGISACRVQHPNAVVILDAGTAEGGTPYLVMELLEGRSLAEEITAHGPMQLSRCARIAVALCSALEAAHASGIVHRDVKPANVFLSRDPRGEETVKVVDFGIAKLVEAHEGGPPTLDEVAGTPQYMAPERLLGDACDWRSDVYSVGVTLFEMLAADYPYFYRSPNALAQAMQQVREDPRSLSEVRPDLPERVVSAVMGALARDPSARPGLAELAATLVRASSEWQEPAWPVGKDLVSAFEETLVSSPRRVPEDASTRDESGTARRDAIARAESEGATDPDEDLGSANGR